MSLRSKSYFLKKFPDWSNINVILVKNGKKWTTHQRKDSKWRFF